MLLRLDAKYMKELADAKAENDALRDDVAAGRRRLHISQASVSQCVKPPRFRRIMQPPPDWQTPLNGIISPQREAYHHANNWKELRSILKQQCR